VEDYQNLIRDFIEPYVSLSGKIGDRATEEQAGLVLQSVGLQLELLKIASASKKPSDDVFQRLFQPILEVAQKIANLRDSNRASKFFNNLSTVSEGIQALSWVGVAPTPGPFVGDMRGGSEFYSNRVLKEFKGVNQTQVDWVGAFNGFLKELQVYIKKHHTTGLTWNPRGGDAGSHQVGQGGQSGGNMDGPAPPPPPPPSVEDLTGGPTGTTSKGPDMSNVFSSLNKGETVTSGLKKVTDDMKSKNRKDKTSVVPAAAIKNTVPKEVKEIASKPPKFALESQKWAVEYQRDNKNLVISDTEPRQTVYIYKCVNTTVVIKGKVNAITVDDCTKTAVVFDTVMASFEVVNCRSVEVQVNGKAPSFAIDKTSGCQLYLSQESLAAEIVTSKSSEMNVLLPQVNDEDMVEIAIPEQYKTTVKNGRLHTEIVQHV